MPLALLLSVRFYDGRYHGLDTSGRPEWPPSPARLFQALVSGAAQGHGLCKKDTDALHWLEKLSEASAAIVAAPPVRNTRGFINYVPNNNDMVVKGSVLQRIGKANADKLIKPLLFDASVPLLYAWQFEPGEEHEKQAKTICAMAERLYQLGRGIDMAWAWGEYFESEKLDGCIQKWLCKHSGAIYRPCDGGRGVALACPTEGSLRSLIERHKKSGDRFVSLMVWAPTKKNPTGTGQAGQTFTQPPRPRFRQVAYDSPPVRLLFNLTDGAGETTSRRLDHVVALTERVRDAAAQRLKNKLPEKSELIHNVIVGRRDADEADKATRVRIMPLPSIGHQYADHAIRRVLIEIPPNCPLRADDVEWAFSGLDLNVDQQTGEILGEEEPVLGLVDDRTMLLHYGIDARQSELYRVWRTVTPAALPEDAARRRIDPHRLQRELDALRNGTTTELKEAKSGRERLGEEGHAAAAVVKALRHAGRSVPVQSIRVQREPFSGRSARAEAIAAGTRFTKERLWHVEIAFAEPQRGPLIIGDGRYLGLGLMAPMRDAWRDVTVFSVSPSAKITLADGPALVRAARRALMALARDDRGRVPRLFSGHEEDCGRAASGRHEHIFLVADDNDGDGRIGRLIVAAPWACDRLMKPNHTDRRTFDTVVSKLETLRAGRLGVLALGRPTAVASSDSLVGRARVWVSRTPYLATRHAGRHKDPKPALIRNITAECERRGLPRPAEVEILKLDGVPNGGGLKVRVRLHFATAVQGPLLLGRDSHRGGGLFATEE